MNTHSSLSDRSGIAERIAPLILRLALGLTDFAAAPILGVWPDAAKSQIK